MRALLDTHAFLWSGDESDRLSSRARDVMRDLGNTLLLSIASIWEIAIKVQSGRLKLPEDPERFLRRGITQMAVEILPITFEHVLRVLQLPLHHRDPFDLMLIAQSQVENVPIITADDMIARYGVEVIW